MAAYTSVTGGNWNDPATWGSASYPSSAGDTATISAGHTVVYNVSSTTELGQITINGILSFLKTATTKLTLGHVDIVINNGGELRVGNSTDKIANGQYAEILWKTTADNAKGIDIKEGGKLTVNGDPAHYGSDWDTTLAVDWTTGQTFTVVGDFTTKWAVGQEITAHKGALYAAYNTDTALFTIKSLTLNGSNTDIEINEARPTGTWKAGGNVNNVSRNVRLGKLGASTAIGNYNTNRPRITDANTVGGNVNINDACFTGFYSAIGGGKGAVLGAGFVIRNGNNGIISGTSHSVSGQVYSNNYGIIYGTSYSVSGQVYSNGNGIHSGTSHSVSGQVYSNNYGIIYGTSHTISGQVYSNSIGLYYGTAHTISGQVYSNNNGLYSCTAHTISGQVYSNGNGINYGTAHTISGQVYSNTVGINYGTSHTISGQVYSNIIGINYGTSHTISGQVYSNTTGIRGCVNLLITGKLSKNALGADAANTRDFDFDNSALGLKSYLRGVDRLATGLVHINRNSLSYPDADVWSQDDGQVIGTHVLYSSFGTVTNDTTVHNLAMQSLKAEPLSNCGAVVDALGNLAQLKIAEWTENNVPASTQNRRVYVKGEAWTSFPTSAELYIEAEYYDSALGWTTTKLKSTQVLTDNTTWTALTLSFAPSRVGDVVYRIVLQKYEAGASVYLDHALYYTPTQFVEATFDWGESVLPTISTNTLKQLDDAQTLSLMQLTAETSIPVDM
jgi:hypothetical protein